MISTQKWLLVVMVLAPGLALSGCNSMNRVTQKVFRRGGEVVPPVRRPGAMMDMVLVTPPQEDVQIGDLYVYPDNPEGDGEEARVMALEVGSRWSTLPVLEALDEEYRARPVWPVTRVTRLNADSDNPVEPYDWAEAENQDQQSIFQGGAVPTRLRLVGLEEQLSPLIVPRQVSDLIPSEVIESLGVGPEQVDVSLKVSLAENYTLSLSRLLPELLDTEIQDGAMPMYRLKDDYRKFLPLMADPSSESLWVRAVNEVIYVRSIDIFVKRKAVPVTYEEVGYSEHENEASSDEPIDAPDPMQRAVAANAAQIEAGTDTTPGKHLHFLGIGDDWVAARRVWSRGIAVAAKGVTLEVNKLTGEVIGIQPMAQPESEDEDAGVEAVAPEVSAPVE